jgi:hypothetical protein
MRKLTRGLLKLDLKLLVPSGLDSCLWVLKNDRTTHIFDDLLR